MPLTSYLTRIDRMGFFDRIIGYQKDALLSEFGYKKFYMLSIRDCQLSCRRGNMLLLIEGN